MKARNVVVSLAAVAAMLVVGQVAASANNVWCISDPPTHVVTPGGTHLTVNNQVWLPASDKELKHQVWDEASAQPDGSGGTLITVTVHVPDGVAAHVVSDQHRFGETDEEDGVGVIILHLDVPTS